MNDPEKGFGDAGFAESLGSFTQNDSDQLLYDSLDSAIEGF